jgi:hypothetical protein
MKAAAVSTALTDEYRADRLALSRLDDDGAPPDLSGFRCRSA